MAPRIELTFVFLLFCCGAEALPGQGSSDEVHEDVAEALHVVSAALLDTEMRVDAGITGRPS